MKQPASIFNDVLGPVMVGPSSSHTAASVRIGRVVRDLCQGRPKLIKLVFADESSIAYTYKSQGAELGLAAGLLGFETDDIRISNASELALNDGIEIAYSIIPGIVPHPNTYHISAFDLDGNQIEIEAISTGGGMISILSINRISVQMDGDFYETLYFFPKEMQQKDVSACKAKIIQDCLFELEDIVLSKGENGYLLSLKSREPSSKEFCNKHNCGSCIMVSPVLPMLSRRTYPQLPNTEKLILKLAESENLTLPEIACKYEMLRSGVSRKQVYEKIQSICNSIDNTLDGMKKDPPKLRDSILGSQAHFLLHEARHFDPMQSSILYNVTLLMEAKSAMRVITAAPTAGSCGLLAGTLYAIYKQMGISKERLYDAWLSAGLVGVIIAEHATFAGEVGGCQAECGSASGMAAAAIVTMLGGTVKQALDAASMALQNVFGMTCDPIANRVEVPCLGKNIMGAMNAYAIAQCIMAGFDKVVPLDETVEAMYKVGIALPIELRCIGLGGLALTPTAQTIDRRLRKR